MRRRRRRVKTFLLFANGSLVPSVLLPNRYTRVSMRLSNKCSCCEKIEVKRNSSHSFAEFPLVVFADFVSQCIFPAMLIFTAFFSSEFSFL